MSYMFQYVVNEYKAQSTLAARGAEIFKDIIQNRVLKEKCKETKEFKRLKERVERIKKKRIKQNHAAEGLLHSHEPKDYYSSIRSGDYYMFESEFEISDSDDDDINNSDSENNSKTKSSIIKMIDKSSSNEGNDSVDNKMTQESTNIDVIVKSSSVPSESVSGHKKQITFKEQVSITDNNGEIIEIEILGPENEFEDKSWLTIENKTTLNIVYYIRQFFFMIIDIITEFCNKYSKDFRIVSHILAKEKLLLKIEYDNSQTPALLALINDLRPENQNSDIHKPSLYQMIEKENNNKLIIEANNEIENFMRSQTRIDKLMSSFFYCLLSQSELVCYFFMILNHLNTASILSVFLPIGVFLWAMMGVPRPQKSFWITVITYIEAIVVVKYIFQFQIFSWNQTATNAADRQSLIDILEIIGINKTDSSGQFAIYDLFVLVVIFLHRNILKTMGLWRNTSADDDALIAQNEEEKGDNLTINENINENEKNSQDDGDGDDENENENEKIDVRVEPKPEILCIENNNENENDYINSDDTDYDEDDYDQVNRKLTIQNRFKKKSNQVKNQSLLNPFKQFYENLNTKHYAVVNDYYAKMFLMDFINCIIIIFTYQYFGDGGVNSNSGSALNSIKENKVPISFLILFLIQFVLMIIDRALYLRKNIHGKFWFQIVLVIVFHVALFFILPHYTNIKFLKNSPNQIYYFVKCVYFGFSARQIRCGYPKRILGNFVTKSYNYVNLILFKGFLLVPFLLELRSLMDWMFTDTSFGLFDWLQMEDIYSNIFVLKCQRYNENKYPTPRGSKRNAIMKYGFGGTLLVIIILIIWFPLLLFSFSEGFKRSIEPSTFKINVQFAGFLPIYSMTSQQRLFRQFTETEYNVLKKNSPQEAASFFKDFKVEDIYCISIPGISTSLWELSPPSLTTLKDQLLALDSLKLDFIYELTRESTEEKEQLSEMVNAIKSTEISNATKNEIFNVLSGIDPDKTISIPSVYPRFSHVRPKGNIIEIDALKSNLSHLSYYADVKLTIRNQTSQLWWEVYDQNPKDRQNNPKDHGIPCWEQSNLNMVLFSDPVAPSSISFITEQGIIGIYITLVLAVSRILRFMVVNSSMRIMFEQLPNVDKILKLLNNIYMVREKKKYLLEEKLFSKLLFLYRSSELMIKYTRPPPPHTSLINSHNKKTKKNQ